MDKTSKLYEYYEEWIKIYKEGAIRDVTLLKYKNSQSWIKRLVPDLTLESVNRAAYQQIINEYAIYHERQTTMDFHHQLKSAVLDAVDEGYIDRDPTRKVVIKGKAPREKKLKYLNQFELHKLLSVLELKESISE